TIEPRAKAVKVAAATPAPRPRASAMSANRNGNTAPHPAVASAPPDSRTTVRPRAVRTCTPWNMLVLDVRSANAAESRLTFEIEVRYRNDCTLDNMASSAGIPQRPASGPKPRRSSGLADYQAAVAGYTAAGADADVQRVVTALTRI